MGVRGALFAKERDSPAPPRTTKHHLSRRSDARPAMICRAGCGCGPGFPEAGRGSRPPAGRDHALSPVGCAGRPAWVGDTFACCLRKPTLFQCGRAPAALSSRPPRGGPAGARAQPRDDPPPRPRKHTAPATSTSSRTNMVHGVYHPPNHANPLGPHTSCKQQPSS